MSIGFNSVSSPWCACSVVEYLDTRNIHGKRIFLSVKGFFSIVVR